MDRRSWLWRRKSSEKSPGETESSGSISSHSERFSDDQAYANHHPQSPEVTSKPETNDEETTDNMKTLREKLSSALLNISAKEELVKQHSKVAEEAIAGWEKAENEVSSLKQQLEAAMQKSSSFDGALKECVRQLRQGREEQEQKIREAIGKKTHEWESTNRELMIERDLSTQAAEAASKQRLEDMRKLAKLEAECKMLKAIARKAQTLEDCKSFADSQSDTGSRRPGRERSNMSCSVEIGLMDDFLEMERLVALPDTESAPTSTESSLRAELDAMIHKTTELEERIEKMEEEKAKQLEKSEGELKEAELKLRALQTQLAQMRESKFSVEEQLKASNVKKEAAESQLRIVRAEIENLNSRIGSLEEDLQKEHDSSAETVSKCEKLEEEVENERAKCRKLEAEVLTMKQGAELQQEKELAVAASKFADCQKTIASLGRQLKSLASLEDFLTDEKPPEVSPQGLNCPKNGMEMEPLKPHLPKTDSELQKPRNDSLSSTLVVKANAASEKLQNGIGKHLPRGRTRFRTEYLRE